MATVVVFVGLDVIINGNQSTSSLGLRHGSAEQPGCSRCGPSFLFVRMINCRSFNPQYLAYKPLPTLLGFLTPSPSTTVATRAKALYTLSGLLKHNAPAVKELDNPELGGWVQLRGALQGISHRMTPILVIITPLDPEISVRRKTAFLLNSLILPTNPNPVAAHQSTPRLIAPPTNATTDSIPSATVESASIIGPTTSMSTMSTTPAESHSAGDSQNGPVHPNSHDAYLKDPSRTDTSTASLEAFDRYNIVGAVISSVVDPVPFGQDGENDKSDADYEEKAMQYVFDPMLILWTSL